MTQYTATKSGFQRAMELCLTGAPSDSKAFTETYATPDFYHVMNGETFKYDTYIAGLAEWRGKVSEYKPVVDEFLRDGDQLAARMTGTIKVEGQDTVFESFMFAKIERGSGKIEYLIERSIWGPAGGAPEHGVS